MHHRNASELRPRRPKLREALLILLAACGCATIRDPGLTLVPTRFQTQVGPYTVFTNGPLGADSPAIVHLHSLRREIEESLGLRPDAAEGPIEVYVLDDAKAFGHFLRFHYPDLPPRRAFFLAQGNRSVVYTYASDHLEEDLRHEATHALLHASVAELPLWLDEGLAEYFEVPGAQGGRNDEHVRRLPQDLVEGWTPDLRALENLKDVRRMTPRDYRESWLWVHYLLNGSKAGKADLLAYLGDLRSEPATAMPLSGRLNVEKASPRLVAHLKHVRDEAIAAEAPPATVVRSQDAALEPARGKGSGRRSLFGRFLGIFGL